MNGVAPGFVAIERHRQRVSEAPAGTLGAMVYGDGFLPTPQCPANGPATATSWPPAGHGVDRGRPKASVIGYHCHRAVKDARPVHRLLAETAIDHGPLAVLIGPDPAADEAGEQYAQQAPRRQPSSVAGSIDLPDDQHLLQGLLDVLGEVTASAKRAPRLCSSLSVA